MIWKLVLLWAIEAQLVDVREEGYVDYGTIYIRVVNMHGLPRLEEANRFPPLEELEECRQEYRRLAEYCEHGARERLHHWETYSEIRKKAERNVTLYQTLGDSKRAYYYVSIRREALGIARELMGEGAFNKGGVP